MSKPTDFEPGQRVQLHPATDAWMMGNRYGTVTRIGQHKVFVRLDRSGKTACVLPRFLMAVE